MSININRQAQSLIEIMLALALAAVLLPAIFAGLANSWEGQAQQRQREYAVGLVREAQEAARGVRDGGWLNLPSNGMYHPVINSGQWALVAGSEVVEGYTRSITVADVYRDLNGNIVTTGGTLDRSTKKITSAVSWSLPKPGSVESVTYLSRYKDNLAYLQTTKPEFDTGVLTKITTTTSFGGEFELSANNKAKWCDPHLSSSTIDLPGKPNAVYAVPGEVYVASGEVADSNQVSFAHVLVGNTDPPTFALNGIVKGYKTQDVFGESGWGYIATSDNGKEVVIVNLNSFDDPVNKIFHQEGYFNTPSSNVDGQTITVVGSRGYMTAGNYLYVFNLSSKSGSRAQIGNRIQFANSGDYAGEVNVRQVGSSIYAYVAIQGSTPEELKIINVTNNSQSSQWRVVGSINIEPNNCSSLESGKAVYVKPNGDRAYISSVNDTTFKEFFSIDTSNKSAPSLIGGFASNPPCTNGGGYEAGGMDPEQSVVVASAENRVVLVGVDRASDGVDAAEYQVLDLSNEANPTMCGGFQYNAGIYGVAGVTEPDSDTFAYIITGDTSNELKVVQGGPDGYYFDSGIYESSVFDVGYETVFNRLSATFNEPNNTQVRFQVAIADGVAGSCNGASYSFVGPDGTAGTYFENVNNTLPFSDDSAGYENPGRCIKYRAYLSTSDYNATPQVRDVTVNYSP
jgi:type II secretory pathway pseudopilin PulG